MSSSTAPPRAPLSSERKRCPSGPQWPAGAVAAAKAKATRGRRWRDTYTLRQPRDSAVFSPSLGKTSYISRNSSSAPPQGTRTQNPRGRGLVGRRRCLRGERAGSASDCATGRGRGEALAAISFLLIYATFCNFPPLPLFNLPFLEKSGENPLLRSHIFIFY